MLVHLSSRTSQLSQYDPSGPLTACLTKASKNDLIGALNGSQFDAKKHCGKQAESESSSWRALMLDDSADCSTVPHRVRQSAITTNALKSASSICAQSALMATST